MTERPFPCGCASGMGVAVVVGPSPGVGVAGSVVATGVGTVGRPHSPSESPCLRCAGTAFTEMLIVLRPL